MYEVRCYNPDSPFDLERSAREEELILAKSLAYDWWAYDQLDVVLVDLDSQEIVLTLDDEDR